MEPTFPTTRYWGDNALPNEILGAMFSELSPSTLIALSCVSQHFKALAERAGVAYNTAHALYTARATRVDLDTIDRICAALQVEPGDLFIRDGAWSPARGESAEGGGYGTDLDRAAGAGDRHASGSL